jgi:hypothetical protein
MPGAASGSVWDTPASGADAGSAWDAPASGAGPAGGQENEWFSGKAPEDAGYRDGTGDFEVRGPAADHAAGRRVLAGRMTPALGAASITFLFACLGVLLVVSSVIWHPRVP